MQRQKVPSPESMNYLCLHKVEHGSGSAVGTAQGAATAASWGAPCSSWLLQLGLDLGCWARFRMHQTKSQPQNQSQVIQLLLCISVPPRQEGRTLHFLPQGGQSLEKDRHLWGWHTPPSQAAFYGCWGCWQRLQQGSKPGAGSVELPTLGKVGEKHPPDLQQGDKGPPAGRCHQNLGEKKSPVPGVGDARGGRCLLLPFPWQCCREGCLLPRVTALRWEERSWKSPELLASDGASRKSSPSPLLALTPTQTPCR